MKLINKDALIAEIERRLLLLVPKMTFYQQRMELEKLLSFINTLEVKEVNEVPASVMVNKYGNCFISSWSGLKEYDDLKEGQEIKILIPKK